MTDAQFFGDSSGAFHLTNAALHAVTATLLFLILRAMTGATWRSGFVAALFAIHPLHVESVAWVSERKDVLCAFFWVLTMGAYWHYARRPRWATFICVMGLMALALLSKPMAVTLPIVLLLLDWWPLKRIDFNKPDWLTSFRKCAIEKLPLLLLSAASSIATVFAQKAAGAVARLESLTLDTRIINALESCGRYLQQTIWPTKLAIFYPYSPFADATNLTAGILTMASVTATAIYFRRRMPYIAMGWMWYLITLVPVIGLVQVGMQARADRYTYLPLVGVFVAIAWLAGDLVQRYRKTKPAVILAVIASIAGLTLLCGMQIQRWRNSITLFEHALAVTIKNAFAHQSLGSALVDKGDLEGGARHFEEAVSINPGYVRPRNNLAAFLIQKGQYDDAIVHCEEILRTAPHFHMARFNLAKALDLSGRKAEAAARYEEFLRDNPADAEARMLYAICFLSLGQSSNAIIQLEEAHQASPTNATILLNLGSILESIGRLNEAVERYNATITLRPRDIEPHRRLGLLLAHMKRLPDAIAQFTEAARLRPAATAEFELALILVMNGQHDLAINHYREALKLQPQFTAAMNDLAWILATHPDANLRNGGEAVKLAEAACELTGYKEARCLGTLDAAYAEAGRFEDAIATAQKAKDLAQAASQPEVAALAEKRMTIYQTRQPYHQKSEEVRSQAKR